MASVLGLQVKNCLQASGQQKPRNANKRKRVKGLLPPKQSVDRIWRHQTGPSPQNGASFVGFIDGNARRCQPRSSHSLKKSVTNCEEICLLSSRSMVRIHQGGSKTKPLQRIRLGMVQTDCGAPRSVEEHCSHQTISCRPWQ